MTVFLFGLLVTTDSSHVFFLRAEKRDNKLSLRYDLKLVVARTNVCIVIRVASFVLTIHNEPTVFDVFGNSSWTLNRVYKRNTLQILRPRKSKSRLWCTTCRGKKRRTMWWEILSLIADSVLRYYSIIYLNFLLALSTSLKRFHGEPKE